MIYDITKMLMSLPVTTVTIPVKVDLLPARGALGEAIPNIR